MGILNKLKINFNNLWVKKSHLDQFAFDLFKNQKYLIFFQFEDSIEIK